MGSTPSKKKQPEKTTVFKPEPGVVYRIPALIYLKETQTYLAFAEKRISKSDHDAKCLVMRKGTSQNGAFQWSPVEELMSASLLGYRTMNPCPVYDHKTKTLFLFFICVLGTTSECWQIFTGKNKARLCYVTSSDVGQTWSGTKDLTDSVIGETVSRWATFAVGPGHGIQLESGRLIIPAYVYYISHRSCCSLPKPGTVKPYSLAIFSDDFGQTWQIGEMLQQKSLECEMAEVIDHNGRSHLYCNGRNTGGFRVEALSENDGASFNKPRLAHELVETGQGCQGSVIGFPTPKDASTGSTGSQTWLLYTHPTSKRSRVDMGVYLNRTPLNSSGWSRPWIIHSGPSGYSDLAYNEDMENFACLMECGKGSELEEIAIASFTMSDVIQVAIDMRKK